MKKALLLSALLLATLACSLDLGFTPPDLPQSEAPAQSSGYAQKSGVEITEDEAYIPDTSNSGLSSEDLVYFDDFSNSESGWDHQSAEKGYTDYYNNAYQMSVYIPSYDIWANPGRYYPGDVEVRVEATLTGGDQDNNYGLLCRYSGTPSSPNFYSFQISSDGYLIIAKTEDGISQYISADNMISSNAVNQGFRTNHLRADCVGSLLTLYVNGVNVASAKDSSLVDGDVGLILGTFDASYTEVVFDNFSVTIP